MTRISRCISGNYKELLISLEKTYKWPDDDSYNHPDITGFEQIPSDSNPSAEATAAMKEIQSILKKYHGSNAQNNPNGEYLTQQTYKESDYSFDSDNNKHWTPIKRDFYKLA